MNVQAVHAIIHTPEDVSSIINEADKIAAVYDETGERWNAIFDKACDLLGQRATTFIAPQQVPFDLMSLKANSG